MWINIVLGFVALVFLMIWRRRRNLGMFSSKGIFELPPYLIFGSKLTSKAYTGQVDMITLLDSVYKDYPNEKLVGKFSFGIPGLVVNDIDYVKLVLVKDFDHFMNRRSFEIGDDTNAQKIMNRLTTSLTGEKWKMVRSKLSPAFTSGKLKRMVPLLQRVGHDFKSHLDELALKGDEFEAKEVMKLFMIDAIGSCGFGVDLNSFKDPDNQFCTMTNKFTSGGKIQMFKILMIVIFPEVGKKLGWGLFDEATTEYFSTIIRDTMKQRETSGAKRNDLIDILLEALKDNSQQVAAEPTEEDQFEKDAQLKTSKLHFSEEEMELTIVASAFTLFVAGFDTSSTTLGIMMLYLAKNQDIQQKLYEEITDAISQNDENPELEYDTIQNLPYLDQTIHETLRLFPLALIERVCTKDYKFPDYDFVVPEGMVLQIPVAFMKDPRYFPNPEAFDPDNFSPENKSRRTPYSFLSFGQGPRNCVGMRFAMLQMKIAIVRLVHGFKVVPGPKTPEKVEHEPGKVIAVSAKGGCWVKVEKR